LFNLAGESEKLLWKVIVQRGIDLRTEAVELEDGSTGRPVSWKVLKTF
jgi:hypothetical protein